MAKPRTPPVVHEAAPAKGGLSALRIVAVGALLAFGGYSAIAGASMLLGRSTEGAGAPVAAKAEFDCGSSRHAWRPECREDKAEVAAADEDKARRTRKRSIAAVDEPPAAPSAALDPAATASVEPLPEAPPPVLPAAPAVEKRTTKRPETPVSVEPKPQPAIRTAAREASRASVESPARERRTESLRFKAEPDAPDRDDPGSTRSGRPKLQEAERRPPARARLVRAARRDAAQFASLRRERSERTRRTRLAAVWEPTEEVDDGGWRSRRGERPLRRRSRTVDRSGLPPGMTVTSVRTYQLPDGRLVSVPIRPRSDEVRALIAQHRANTASYFPW